MAIFGKWILFIGETSTTKIRDLSLLSSFLSKVIKLNDSRKKKCSFNPFSFEMCEKKFNLARFPLKVAIQFFLYESKFLNCPNYDLQAELEQHRLKLILAKQKKWQTLFFIRHINSILSILNSHKINI